MLDNDFACLESIKAPRFGSWINSCITFLCFIFFFVCILLDLFLLWQIELELCRKTEVNFISKSEDHIKDFQMQGDWMCSLIHVTKESNFQCYNGFIYYFHLSIWTHWETICSPLYAMVGIYKSSDKIENIDQNNLKYKNNRKDLKKEDLKIKSVKVTNIFLRHIAVLAVSWLYFIKICLDLSVKRSSASCPSSSGPL